MPEAVLRGSKIVNGNPDKGDEDILTGVFASRKLRSEWKP